MNWLEQEEKNLSQEIKMKDKTTYCTKNMILFLGFIAIILTCQILQADCLTCPCCLYEIGLEPAKAKEVPYAGWYCDNCGWFQCHGDKCVKCKHPRHQRSWDGF